VPERVRGTPPTKLPTPVPLSQPPVQIMDLPIVPTDKAKAPTLCRISVVVHAGMLINVRNRGPVLPNCNRCPRQSVTQEVFHAVGEFRSWVTVSPLALVLRPFAKRHWYGDAIGIAAPLRKRPSMSFAPTWGYSPVGSIRCMSAAASGLEGRRGVIVEGRVMPLGAPSVQST